MRMKKIILIAAVAIAAAACSKTFDTNPAASEQAIGFGTWAEGLTKAVPTPTNPRIQGSSAFREGDSFSVYGYKSAADETGKVSVFENVTVVATAETTSGTPAVTSASAWDYDIHRFWDKNFAKYTFFAVSPADAATVNYQTGAITNVSKTFSGKDNDILVASKKVVNKGDAEPYFQNYGKVELLFNHAATLVDVKMKKSPSLANNTVQITAFSLNAIEDEGALSVASYEDGTGLPVISWTGTGTTNYGPADGVTEVTLPIAIEKDDTFTTGNDNASYVPSNSTFIVNNLVVKPQAINAQNISLTYKIEGDEAEHTATLNFADFDKVDNNNQNQAKVGDWLFGKHYTFYITIDAKAIEFSASISDWETVNVNGYHYILN